MNKYKAGDRVRIVRSPFCGETRQAGAVGTVSHIPSRVRGDVEIDFEGLGGEGWGFYFREIEHADYKPVPGDRVRVVLEGGVSSDARGYFHVGKHGEGNSIDPKAEHVVSIEKIEPPVEVFQPGDVVRHKDAPGLIYSIGRDGYLSHSMHRFFEWFPEGSTDPGHFNSKYFEKVSLG